jgi:hypothetical protein
MMNSEFCPNQRNVNPHSVLKRVRGKQWNQKMWEEKNRVRKRGNSGIVIILIFWMGQAMIVRGAHRGEITSYLTFYIAYVVF